MCIFSTPKPVAAAPAIIPAATNATANQEASLEEALRRRRAGAAANVLTGPLGIPAARSPARPVVAKLGGVA